MKFLLILVVTTVLVFLLKRPIKRCPWAFYALTIVLSVLYFVNISTDFLDVLRSPLFLLMQKCTLSLALFTVVMFIGVFPKDSFVGTSLRPIRAELSIMAGVLALGHMTVYLKAFMPRFFGGGIGEDLLLFVVTIVLLTVLLVVLCVTSAQWAKRLMEAASWRRLQKLAYVFFGLVYVHLLSILLPAALLGGKTAIASVVVYTVLFAAYAALRIRFALLERKERMAKEAANAAEGAEVAEVAAESVEVAAVAAEGVETAPESAAE